LTSLVSHCFVVANKQYQRGRFIGIGFSSPSEKIIKEHTIRGMLPQFTKRELHQHSVNPLKPLQNKRSSLSRQQNFMQLQG